MLLKENDNQLVAPEARRPGRLNGQPGDAKTPILAVHRLELAM